jgi:hypothetical protein
MSLFLAGRRQLALASAVHFNERLLVCGYLLRFRRQTTLDFLNVLRRRKRLRLNATLHKKVANIVVVLNMLVGNLRFRAKTDPGHEERAGCPGWTAIGGFSSDDNDQGQGFRQRDYQLQHQEGWFAGQVVDAF